MSPHYMEKAQELRASWWVSTGEFVSALKEILREPKSGTTWATTCRRFRPPAGLHEHGSHSRSLVQHRLVLVVSTQFLQRDPGMLCGVAVAVVCEAAAVQDVPAGLCSSNFLKTPKF